MAVIYAMSDIHGFYDIMQENLSLIDFSDRETKLVLCGDFIDYGPDSSKVLYKIKALADGFPSQVAAIMGNHELMFLAFLNAKEDDIWNFEWLDTDKDFSTINTFITKSCREKIERVKSGTNYHDYLFYAAKIIKEDLLLNHKELILWLKNLPFYYETEAQIFVHAGIDEEAGEYWKHGTPNEYYANKYPATFGAFYKDIIAGHISTSSLAKNEAFHAVFWDGRSHFFIDGQTRVSGVIPILKYDTETLTYSSFTKEINSDRRVKWSEYFIKNGRPK